MKWYAGRRVERQRCSARPRRRSGLVGSHRRARRRPGGRRRADRGRHSRPGVSGLARAAVMARAISSVVRGSSSGSPSAVAAAIAASAAGAPSPWDSGFGQPSGSTSCGSGSTAMIPGAQRAKITIQARSSAAARGSSAASAPVAASSQQAQRVVADEAAGGRARGEPKQAGTIGLGCRRARRPARSSAAIRPACRAAATARPTARQARAATRAAGMLRGPGQRGPSVGRDAIEALAPRVVARLLGPALPAAARHHCRWRSCTASLWPSSASCSAPNWRIVSRRAVAGRLAGRDDQQAVVGQPRERVGDIESRPRRGRRPATRRASTSNHEANTETARSSARSDGDSSR